MSAPTDGTEFLGSRLPGGDDRLSAQTEESRRFPNRSTEGAPDSNLVIERLIRLCGRGLNFDVTILFSLCREVPDVVFAPSYPDVHPNRLRSVAKIAFDRHGFVGISMLDSQPEFKSADWVKGGIRASGLYGHALATTSGPVGSLCGFFCFGHTRMLNLEELRDFRHYADLITRELQLSEEAHTDPLTQLWNRRYFYRALTGEFNRARRYRIPLQIAMIDLDHLKTINDTFGHHVGDVVLRDVAAVLKAAVHRQGDLVARIGGDEFAMLLSDCDRESAAALLEDVRTTVETLAIDVLQQAGFQPTVSIGFTSCHPTKAGVIDPPSVMERSDGALYTAKQRGRNRVIHVDL